ncbi:MAG: DUF3786 domain-containing protein [Victivallaceae bacterium]|nr:DUF3786 domain-containing protein [Victivallaceae bacterium]
MLSNKQYAVEEAVNIAIEKLQSVDIKKRCALHGLEVSDNKLNMRLFGQDMILDVNDFTTAAKPADLLLVLHYLLCNIPVKKTGELISFREFTGGQFYYEPFLSRTVKPLTGKYGNDIETIKKCITKFDYEEVKLGDFGAKIQSFGPFEITLIYHLGDDEFQVDAEVLFDSSFKRAFAAEDAAVIAGRICIGLLF